MNATPQGIGRRTKDLSNELEDQKYSNKLIL